MTKIILCGPPKRASTAQRRVRSTESYALVRSMKHTYSGIYFFHTSSCNRRTTNIISVVEVVRLKTTLFLRQDSHALAVVAEATSDDLQQYLAGEHYQRDAPVVAALCPILFLWSTMMMAYFHYCGTTPPLHIRTTISSSLPRRAGSPLRVILNSFRQRADGVGQPCIVG